jgi:hypothetical protein
MDLARKSIVRKVVVNESNSNDRAPTHFPKIPQKNSFPRQK